MDAYSEFAYFYDRLINEQVDYKKWAEFILDKTVTDTDHIGVLDLACGTGNITIELAKLGCNVTGVDISEDMLFIAREKSRALGLKIMYVCQDMLKFHVHHEMDLVTCVCDGLNYIISDKNVEAFIKRVYNVIKDNGYFLFDVSSLYKLSEVLGCNTMTDVNDDISYIWQNVFDEHQSIINMYLTFFVKENGLHRRIDEFHCQRAYKTKYLKELLYKVGFSKVLLYDNYTDNSIHDKSQRIVFIAYK